MKIYYLDEPLDHDELENIKKFLIEREGNKYTIVIDQIRIPTILPTSCSNGIYMDELRNLINHAKRILIKTGLVKDHGNQIVFVMAKDNFWNGIFQLAISEITGYYPYIIQRWYYIDDEVVRGNIRLIDGHGLMGYKD